jgi:hypothetical protein
MKGLRARASVDPAIPLAVVVFVACPGFEAAAPRGVRDEKGSASIAFVKASQVPFAEVRGALSVPVEHVGDSSLAFR